MKTRFILILNVVLFFSAILFSKQGIVSAQPKTIRSGELVNLLTTSTPTLAPGSIIHITPTPSPQTGNEERILKVLINLVNLANSNYLHAGWLYCSSESQLFKVDQQTLPDGSPIPLKYTHHSWYRLDDTGKVLQAISFEDTGDSHTSQFTVYQNGIWKNITLGTSYAEESYVLKLHNGIVESVQNLGETDTVSMDLISLNGANVVKIEKRYYYPKLTQLVINDPRKYIGNAITQYVDQETGLITQTDQSYIKNDGSLEVTHHIYNSKCEQQPNTLSVYFNPPE